MRDIETEFFGKKVKCWSIGTAVFVTLVILCAASIKTQAGSPWEETKKCLDAGGSYKNGKCVIPEKAVPKPQPKTTPKPTPKKQQKRKRVSEPDIVSQGAGLCPTGFAYIPAGTFMMGSPMSEKRRYGDETQHRVTISRGILYGEV